MRVRLLWMVLSLAAAAPAASAQRAGIAVPNAGFETARTPELDGDRSCFKGWQFRVASGQYEVEAARDRGQNVFARVRSSGKPGRADLQSAALEVPPFTEVRLQVSVRVADGATGVVCLHAADDRRQVDVALASGPAGKWQVLKATLRTGAKGDTHHISLGIVGEGRVDFDALRVERGKTWGPGKGTVLILDLNDRAPEYEAGAKFWMRREIAANWGYQVEVMNYHDFTAAALARLDPVCLVLTPLASRNPPKVDAEKHKESRERTYALLKKLNRPAIGVCLGHQWLGFSAGVRTKKAGEKGDVVITRTGDDAVFEGIPQQYPCSQSHRYSLSGPPPGFRTLAETEVCKIQVIKAKRRPIYGFQGHMERGWSGTTPHGRVLWGNFFRIAERAR